MILDPELVALTGGIGPLDTRAMDGARRRQDRLAKPPGSLGRLEELSVQLAGITGRVVNSLDKKALLVFCADNGVVEEGVAVAPPSVTAAQTVNLVRHKTGASVIARRFGVELYVCDVGVNARIPDSRVSSAKIAPGTGNIARGPAMSRQDAVRAILAGARTAAGAIDAGAQVVGVGEMGIGNTTTSAAVLAALTGESAGLVTGRGGGLTDEGYERKLRAVETALAVNAPDAGDPVDVLSKVGGFDLCAMCGAFLLSASRRTPAVIDGLISAVAALCAVRLCPEAAGFLIPSHASAEPGYLVAMKALGLEPLFDLRMRLGEGSGCPIAMMILDAACAVMGGMATFDEAGIDDGYLEPIREKEGRA